MAIKYTFVPKRNVKVIKYLNRSIISVMEGIHANCVLDIEISPLHLYIIDLFFFFIVVVKESLFIFDMRHFYMPIVDSFIISVYIRNKTYL